MDVNTYQLAAGVRQQYLGTAKFFMLIKADSPIKVEFLKNGSPVREVGNNVEAGYVSKPGDWRNPDDRFDGFMLTSAAAQTVTIGTSDREGDYRRALALVQIDQPNGLSTAADVAVSAAAVIVAAANGNRRRVIVQNTGAANIRVGDVDVAAARGVRLVPGGSVLLETNSDVYAIREAAADSSVGVLEEVKL